MDKEKYLERIGYTGNIEPTQAVLYHLHSAHLYHVPFENLDIYYRIPIELSLDKIYRKIVESHRGGFCYELNGLFYELLRSLGFNVKMVSARVYMSNGDYSPEFDHLMNVVKIDDDEYLTDIGYGKYSFKPLKLSFGEIQHDGKMDYVIGKFQDGYLQVSKMENGEKIPIFIFKNISKKFSEFEDMCRFHQTNPVSPFTKKRFITLPHENGRNTILGNTLKQTTTDSTTEIEINDESEFKNLLKTIFNVEIQAF